jgi:hypothetical protein
MATVINPIDDKVLADDLVGCDVGFEALELARAFCLGRQQDIVLRDDDGDWILLFGEGYLGYRVAPAIHDDLTGWREGAQ